MCEGFGCHVPSSVSHLTYVRKCMKDPFETPPFSLLHRDICLRVTTALNFRARVRQKSEGVTDPLC